MHYIEIKKGLDALLKRTKEYGEKAIHEEGSNLDEFTYWRRVVEGCIKEGLAMDEVDWENTPTWFKPLCKGLK